MVRHPARRRLLARALRVATLCALVVADSPVAASPVDLFGFGGRGPAMGGAVYSTASGPEAVYYNPAGLAFDTERRFSIGYQRADFHLEVEQCTPSVDDAGTLSFSCGRGPWDARAAPAMNLGFGIPIPFGGPLEDRVTLGLAFVLPTTSILADTKRPGDLSYVLVENRAQTVAVQGGLGIRITDWLSVGWAMLALAELTGQIDVFPNDTGSLSSEAGDEAIADYSNALGLMLRPTRDLSLAVVWRQESIATYQLPISADLGSQFPIPVPELRIDGTAQFDPRQISVEVSGRPFRQLLLGGALTFKHWSEFPAPIAYTAVPEFYPEQPQPNFEDTVVVRFGAEATLDMIGDWELLPRAGFIIEPSPVPEQTGMDNYLDNDRTILTAGLGLRWDVIHVDIVSQLHLLPDRTSRKECAVVDDFFVPPGGTPAVHPEIPPPLDVEVDPDDPLAADPLVIPPTYPLSNPGCDHVTHGGSVFFWGLQLGVDL